MTMMVMAAMMMMMMTTTTLVTITLTTTAFDIKVRKYSRFLVPSVAQVVPKNPSNSEAFIKV
jgi:hypothetical protein